MARARTWRPRCGVGGEGAEVGLVAFADADLGGPAAGDLQNEAGGSIAGQGGFGVRRCVLVDADDAATFFDEEDIEWDERVFHPEGERGAGGEEEEHAVSPRELFAEHQPALA